MYTVEQTIVSFLTDRKAQGLSPNTIKAYTNELTIFQNYLKRGIDIDELTPTQLREYLLHLKELGRNPGGLHIAYRVLRTWLYFWELEMDNEYKAPIRKVKAPKLSQEPLEPVSLKHVSLLLRTCMTDYFGVRDKAMIYSLLDTGLRASELLDIDITDVDINGTILIRNGKGGKSRMVYFTPTTRRALRRYLNIHKGSLALFTDRDGIRLTYSGIRQMLKRRSQYADIPRVTAHMFRRAYALEMLRAGVDVFTLSRLMGHADERVLARYLKLVASDLEQAHRQNSPVDRL
jgi:integrase/recombinase XerC/integrase/recombinase XerD